jgi:DhnA family fructose-bisphosphate aldolase class Ia
MAMTAIGKTRRMAQMFRKDSGRMLCLAMDHGMMVGPIEGIGDPGPLIDAAVTAGVDAVIVSPGMLSRYHVRFAGGPAIILRLDQTTMWREGTAFAYPDAHQRLVFPVEDAVQMGAEAVMTYLFTCNNRPEEETHSFEICSEVARDCRRFGLVHVIEAMAARGGFVNPNDPSTVAMNCRIATEIGADILKTDWCGAAGMADVAATAIAPVCVAGGAADGSEADLMAFAQAAVGSGAKGLMFGRNVFQRPDPADVLSRLVRTVHG